MKRIGLWLEFLVQFLWMDFLIVLVVDSGTLRPASLFLNPKYYWLLYLSMIFFAFFLSNTLIKILKGGKSKGGFPFFLYLLIPLFLFPASIKANLGTSTVERRGLVFKELQSSELETETPVTVPDPSIFDSPEYKNLDGTDRYYKILTEPEINIGREVTLIGQAAFNERLPEDSFYIFKFIIFCCAADATPTGFIVTGLDPVNIEQNKWYLLKGTVGMTEVDGKEFMSLQGNSITQIVKPKVQYEIY